MMLSVGSYQLRIPASRRQQSAHRLASTEDHSLFVGIGLTWQAPSWRVVDPDTLLTLRLSPPTDAVEAPVAEARAPDGLRRTAAAGGMMCDFLGHDSAAPVVTGAVGSFLVCRVNDLRPSSCPGLRRLTNAHVRIDLLAGGA
jgi:hypothetical protein